MENKYYISVEDGCIVLVKANSFDDVQYRT